MVNLGFKVRLFSRRRPCACAGTDISRGFNGSPVRLCDRPARKQGSDQGSGEGIASAYGIDDFHPGCRQRRYTLAGINGAETIPAGKYDHAKCILFRQLAARSIRILRKRKHLLQPDEFVIVYFQHVRDAERPVDQLFRIEMLTQVDIIDAISVGRYSFDHGACGPVRNFAALCQRAEADGAGSRAKDSISSVSGI